QRRGAGRKPGRAPQQTAMPSTRASVLAGHLAVEEHLREAVILATLIANPQVVPDFESELERMECHVAEHLLLRAAILRHAHAEDLRAAIAAEIGAGPLEILFGQSHVAITPAVRRPGDAEIAR